MIRRLNLNKRRNKICTFFHLLCLMNIKKQTSLGKFKYNLNQTPMPLLFCKPLNWKARLSHAEETLANQHDPRRSSKVHPLLFLSRVSNNFPLVVRIRTQKQRTPLTDWKTLHHLKPRSRYSVRSYYQIFITAVTFGTTAEKETLLKSKKSTEGHWDMSIMRNMHPISISWKG